MKPLLLLLLLLLNIICSAQTTMTIEVPPAGVLLKSQLWNVLLVNSASLSKQLKLGLVVTDADTHEPVLSGVTAPFTLSVGARQLKAADLSIQYEYQSAFVPDRNPNGFIGAGNYEACYTAYNLTDAAKADEALEDCINFTVEPLSPPQLNIPADGSVLPVVNQFSWLPPSPVTIFSSLLYDFILVEVHPGQTPAEAVQQNMPVINSNNRDLFLNPSLNPALDTGKIYAWQVVAKNNNQYAAQSEVWTFKLSHTISTEPKLPTNYIVLTNTQKAGSVHVITSDTVRMNYYSFDETHEAIISIVNSNNQTERTYKRKIAYGNNYFEFDIGKFSKKEEVYSISITDKSNQKHIAFFALQSTKTN